MIEIFVDLSLDTCVPYTQRACLDASQNQGLQLGGEGKQFINHYATKGCHAQGKFAFYGIEAAELNRHRKSLVKPFYRPNGYDCSKYLNITSKYTVLYSFALWCKYQFIMVFLMI